MERKLGICLNFDDDTQLAEIEKICKDMGFMPKLMTLDTLDEDFVRESEVLFGFFPRKLLGEAKNLKWFQSSYAGVEKFSDPSVYHSPDVVLTNSKGAYGLAISEYMICAVLMLMRRIPEYTENRDKKIWKNLGNIDSVYGSKAAVIGLGDIGSNFAKRLKAMGCYVKAVRNDKTKASPYADEIFSPDEIDEAIKDCDIVALSMPSTKETEHTMTRERFESMKEGSYFINVGRGSAVDQKALMDNLKNHHLAGAALDVFQKEPLPQDDEAWDIPNLIITPHISGNTGLKITRQNIINIFKDNLGRYVKGEKLINVIDMNKGY